MPMMMGPSSGGHALRRLAVVLGPTGPSSICHEPRMAPQPGLAFLHNSPAVPHSGSKWGRFQHVPILWSSSCPL